MAFHVLRTDGAARGNPGPAGVGILLEDPTGRIIARLSEGIGHATNNVAEYRALILGLEVAAEQGVEELKVLSDSTLMVQQMRGVFKVRNEALKLLHGAARELLGPFKKVRFEAIPREKNKEADELANRGIDEA